MMFFHGIQIQLLTYMDIIAEKQQKMPAGVLYFNLIEPIINSGKNLTEEERRNFVPDILVVNTNNIILNFFQDEI